MTKICSKCKNEKGVDDFYSDRRKPDGLRSQCKQCHNEGSRDWQARNRDRDLANKRRYIKKRREDPEYCVQERRAWGEWDRNNPALSRQRDDRRRARKIGAICRDEKGTVEYRQILNLDPCSYCGEPSGTIDHIVPLIKGGENDWLNLTAACLSCNSSKGTKSLLEALL